MPQITHNNVLFADSKPFEFIKEQLSLLSDTGRLFVVSTGKILKITGINTQLKELEKSGKCFIHILKTDGEKCKSFSNVNLILKKLTETGYGKNDILIGIGGGTITDLSGFCAAIYKRGMRLAFIPTTLLCMVDASIGGKNAININRIKNAAGTFYNPEKIFIIPDLLKTLPSNEMANGMFEALKYGLLFSKTLVTEINQKDFDFTYYNSKSKRKLINIIKQCIQFKQEIITSDYLDKGRRMLLNAGHTFGHAIESTSNNRISHGVAVGIGLYLENMLGSKLQLTANNFARNIKKAIINFFEKSHSLELLKKWITKTNINKIKKHIANDKKAQIKFSASESHHKNNKIACFNLSDNMIILKMPVIIKTGTAILQEINLSDIPSDFI